MFFPMQYKRIIWGLVIALIDIRIGYIDIFPDFIGYILVTMGLSELAEQHIYYGKAKNFSQWLILFSLSDVYNARGNMGAFNLPNWSILIMTVSMAAMIIKLFTVYYICQAIIELSRDRNMDHIGEKAVSRWKAYLIINGAILLMMPFTLIMGPAYGFALIIFVIAALVAEVFLIALVNTAGKELY